MADNTRNNGSNKDGFFVNTKGRNYYGRGQDGAEKALSTNYVNDFIKVGIHNPLPVNKQDKQKYDYEVGTTIFLVPKAAYALSKLLKKGVKALENGKKMKSAISSGANLIEVSTGGRFNTEEGVLTLTIFGKLNENKTPEIYDIFQFNNEVLINDYDVTSNGAVYDLDSMSIDVEYFYEQLHDFAVSMANGSVHAHKREHKWLLDRFAARQLSIAEKLGIAMDISKGGGKSNQVSWGTNSSSKTESPQIESITSSADLESAISAITG